MIRRTALALGSLALLLAAAAPAWADGFIVIRRPPREVQPPVPLAVKYHNVTVKIDDPVSATTIDQVFHNPNPMQLEGEYIFPLPEGSLVTKFNMVMNGVNVEGELLEADKARQIYEDIVRSMRDPALLEYMGTRMFRARVFPIPASGDTKIGLTYSEMLASDAGLRTYRYPLNTEKFSSRPLESVVIGMELNTKEVLKNVYSPSHTVEIARKGDRQAKISYEAKNLKPDQDFVLYYSTSQDEFGLNVATWTPPGEEGVFLVMISPSFDAGRVQPKDVVFVVDTSLSMATTNAGAMDAAKKALRYCIQAMRPGDRFNVVDFSMEVRQFADRLLPADRENVEAALSYVDGLQARGATAIDDALRTALEMGGEASDRPYMIVFMTDGTPTWGERDVDKILANVKERNKRSARIFAFGVGDEIDTMLLDRLARNNRGARDFILGKEDLEIKVTRFFDKVANPVLSDLTLEIQGLDTFDVYPKPLSDLFKGEQLAVLGRFKGDGTHAVVLSGKVGGQARRYIYEARFDGKSGGGEFLPRFWASLKIGALLEEIRLRGEHAELKAEIVRLSKRYGIMNNRYVSFLVTEDTARPTPTPAPGGTVWRERRAEEAEKNGGEGFSGAPGELGAADAAGGRRAAQGIDKAKKGLRGGEAKDELGDRVREMVKYVADRTFYLENGVWTDSGYDGKAEVAEVEFMSEGYFDLLKKNPGIGKFLALGDRVLVLADGKAYRVVKA